MGNKGSRSKVNKEFQTVIPYTPSTRPNPKKKKTQPRRPTVAPALLAKESSFGSVNSGDGSDLKEKNSAITKDNPRRIPLRSPSISEDVGWTPESSNFDFSNTEGQNRRELIASCEDECSMITPFLFVGGFKVANSIEALKKNNITRIVNCSLCAVDNVFEHDDSFTYLSLNMLDGRQDDVSWFLCEVINFIEIARKDKCNTLLHCEKGISRSCSFAISYIMWAAGCQWKTAFDYVRERRQSCSPNTGFTCNLIEIDELFFGDSRLCPLMFRLAQHLPHDRETPIFKLIRNADSRNVIRPHFSFLNSKGVFIIRPSRQVDSSSVLYIWKGGETDISSLKVAISLAEMMLGVLSDATRIEVVLEGSEGDEFKDNVEPNTSHTIVDYDDLYDPGVQSEPVPEEIKFHVASGTTTVSWINGENDIQNENQNLSQVQKKNLLKLPSRMRVDEALSGKFLVGVENFKANPAVIFSEPTAVSSSPPSSTSFPKLNLQDQFKRTTSKVTPSPVPSPVKMSKKEDEVSEAVSVGTGARVGMSLSVTTFNESHNENPAEHDGVGNSDCNGITSPERDNEEKEHGPQKGGGDDILNLTVLSPAVVQSGDSTLPKGLNLNLSIPTSSDLTDTPTATLTAPEVKVSTVTSAISRTKPALFQSVSVEQNGIDSNVLWEWQHMGVYDDDDLLEDSFLFLLCPEGMAHQLWMGSDCSQGVEGGEDKEEWENAICHAMMHVGVGESPVTAEDLQCIFSSMTKNEVNFQFKESEGWWDIFNDGM